MYSNLAFLALISSQHCRNAQDIGYCLSSRATLIGRFDPGALSFVEITFFPFRRRSQIIFDEASTCGFGTGGQWRHAIDKLGAGRKAASVCDLPGIVVGRVVVGLCMPVKWLDTFSFGYLSRLKGLAGSRGKISSQSHDERCVLKQRLWS